MQQNRPAHPIAFVRYALSELLRRMRHLMASRLAEIPSLGRTPIYIVTLFLFMILQVPTALVSNFAGFCILRFLYVPRGFFINLPAHLTETCTIGPASSAVRRLPLAEVSQSNVLELLLLTSAPAAASVGDMFGPKTRTYALGAWG